MWYIFIGISKKVVKKPKGSDSWLRKYSALKFETLLSGSFGSLSGSPKSLKVVKGLKEPYGENPIQIRPLVAKLVFWHYCLQH